jgi:hypothetical protein
MTGAFASLPAARLELMAAAGRELAAAEKALARQGCNVVSRLLRDSGPFYEWDHYPTGDVRDPVHGAQYFYHAHAADQRPAHEHGHFHAFLRADRSEALQHIVAVAMDGRGRPIRLFTVNRWATEDSWAEAGRLIHLLDRFILDLRQPSRWVNRWLTALLRLYRPQVEMLLRERDAAIAAWRQEHPGADAFADRELEVLSEIAIAVPAQIDAVDRALARARPRRAG